MLEQIRYDKYGRMLYNPEFHTNHGKPWTNADLEYLINWYDIVGPLEMSFALGRTYKVVSGKANELRKKGLMKPPTKHRRNIPKDLNTSHANA